MPNEQRRVLRKPVQLSAFFSHRTGTWVAKGGDAMTLNLSERGALIRSQHAFASGDELGLALNLSGGKSVHVEGRVAHVEPLEGGVFDVGVHFRNLTPDDQYLIELQLAKTPSA